MGLRSVLNVGRTIVVRGQEIKINGVTLSQLAQLVKDHSDTLNNLFREGATDFSAVYKDSPVFVASIIAYGTGTPQAELEEEVRFINDNLSFVDQLQLVEAIWDETVPDGEALKKLLGRLDATLTGLEKNPH